MLKFQINYLMFFLILIDWKTTKFEITRLYEEFIYCYVPY